MMDTGLDDCLKMLPACCRKRRSATEYNVMSEICKGPLCLSTCPLKAQASHKSTHSLRPVLDHSYCPFSHFHGIDREGERERGGERDRENMDRESEGG